MQPHPRTLRKARLQVQLMVTDGFSARQIRNYLHRFVLWWTKTIKIWNYAELLMQFCSACYDIQPIAIAMQLVTKHLNKSHTRADYVRGPADGFGAVRGVV